jgi:hypothetical protein
VREVLNRQTGLNDWSTFSRVSEHITNLYSDILRTTKGGVRFRPNLAEVRRVKPPAPGESSL